MSKGRQTPPTLLRWTGSHFVPDDEYAAGVCKRFKPGEVVRCDFMRVRSLPSLRRWWALARFLSFHAPEHMNLQNEVIAHGWMKCNAGHGVPICSAEGVVEYMIPDSISFERLSEDDFRPVVQRANNAIAEKVLPEVHDPYAQGELLRFIGLSGGGR